MPTATRQTKSSPHRSRRGPERRPASNRLMQPEDLLKFIFLADARISPDGSRILFVRKHIEKNKYLTNLWMVNADGKAAATQFTSAGKDKLPRWSADGSRIAFIRSNEDTGKSQVFVMNTIGGEARALTDLPEGSITALEWSPDGKNLAITFRETHTEWTKEAEKKRKDENLSTPPRVIDDPWYRLDGDGYFLSSRYAIYLVDAETGKHRKVFDKDCLGDYTFDFSPNGRTLAITANPEQHALYRPWNSNIYLLDVASGKVTTVPNLPKGPKVGVKWAPDGKRLAYAGREGTNDSEYSTENLNLWVCDARKGNAFEITKNEDYCLMAVSLSDAAEVAFGPTFDWLPGKSGGDRIFMRIGWHGEGRLASVSVRGTGSAGVPPAGKIEFHTTGPREDALGTFSRDGSKMAFLRMTPTRLPEVCIADVIGERGRPARSAADGERGRPARASLGKVRQLTDFNGPFLSEFDLVEPESHWTTAKDGTKVQVWVMRPHNGEGGRPTRRNGPDARNGKSKKIPALLEIHGGPHAQYGYTFFHEFQSLVAAGYAVFFSNPRGSKGYGRDFCHAIRGCWGGKDWEDIQAVTAFMKAQPWVDAKKMGVLGGSYGGYMTNWVIGHTNEFAGAITDRCVSNLISMWGNSDFPYLPDKYWPGNAWDKPEAVWSCSPVKYLGNARTPTLIIHSEGDLRCNIEQAEQVYTILKTHDVPVRFVRYPASTSHGLSRGGPPDLRLHRLHQMLGWWKRWLRNGK